MRAMYHIGSLTAVPANLVGALMCFLFLERHVKPTDYATIAVTDMVRVKID